MFSRQREARNLDGHCIAIENFRSSQISKLKTFFVGLIEVVRALRVAKIAGAYICDKPSDSIDGRLEVDGQTTNGGGRYPIKGPAHLKIPPGGRLTSRKSPRYREGIPT